ncbi:uncharacterized protein LOC131680718 [Topomyia yanbarensis]|uniref:uncharacterized protein LOC131680718 n=1 Tax=Topomyia yanbarensis TaxID=2498891 RepID=UPI00273B5F50|nr:uncharacterized protein LOC131680718 [Topomyia yanbarensis]
MTTEKVLGMWWCTLTDTFTYKLSRNQNEDLLLGRRKPTKREVLRMLMSIFDPLGLISHILIFLKVLLQEVWRSSIEMDDIIPEKLQGKWEQWPEILPEVQNIRIPRCYRSVTPLNPETTVQLHTFVDASESGYACDVYLRFQNLDSIECSIVGAKSRVAPLKFLSIPRLELQAAVIGARLANSITQSLSLKIDQHIFWSDSRDVLYCIRSDHRRYSQFVAFRVSEILETTGIDSWRWLPSKENVADEATKWQRRPTLESNSRWFSAPGFLWQMNGHWPSEPLAAHSTEEELRPNLFYHEMASESPIRFERFFRWKHLLRVTAMVWRFVANTRCKGTSQRTTGPLSREQLQHAERCLYKLVQQDSFAKEIQVLSSSNDDAKLVPKSSSIYRENPYLDDQGVVRRRGRTNLCTYATTDAKNLVILPKTHHVTRLIVQDYHVRYHHRNHETIVNEVRQRYYIPKLRVVYRRVRSECQLCKNRNAVPHAPRMAELPSVRLAAFERPFSYVGVDYFGPLSVVVGRRTEKHWGVLITCLTIRAIHLEIAHSLSTDSCVMALRNFMARRGVPNRIYSDRGTNFKAASKELKAMLKDLDQDKMIREIVSPQMEWTFLPPASPHMGGSWERLIQTVKINLDHIKPERNLTDEILSNTLIKIENIVNSRPLTYVPLDDPDAPVLTPNHFILGSSSGFRPATLLGDRCMNLKRSWRCSQVEANLFWKRWVRDYLPEISKQTKWYKDVKPIGIGDIVVIVDSQLPRNCWPKGRIIAVNISRDGRVRSATVQTAKGIYESPAVKLAVLDVRRELVVNQLQADGVRGGV